MERSGCAERRRVGDGTHGSQARGRGVDGTCVPASNQAKRAVSGLIGLDGGWLPSVAASQLDRCRRVVTCFLLLNVNVFDIQTCVCVCVFWWCGGIWKFSLLSNITQSYYNINFGAILYARCVLLFFGDEHFVVLVL